MRLDLFLKVSRLCPRRTIAQQLCDAGHVAINGLVAKSSHAVKAGDQISITRRDKITTVSVKAVPSSRQASRNEAASLYEIIEEQSL